MFVGGLSTHKVLVRVWLYSGRFVVAGASTYAQSTGIREELTKNIREFFLLKMNMS